MAQGISQNSPCIFFCHLLIPFTRVQKVPKPFATHVGSVGLNKHAEATASAMKPNKGLHSLLTDYAIYEFMISFYIQIRLVLLIRVRILYQGREMDDSCY
jgi:hypothetical protein